VPDPVVTIGFHFFREFKATWIYEKPTASLKNQKKLSVLIMMTSFLKKTCPDRDLKQSWLTTNWLILKGGFFFHLTL